MMRRHRQVRRSFGQTTLATLLVVLGVACMGSGESKLITAAAGGDAAQVSALLEGGVNPDGRANDDWTALTVAAREGHPAVVEVLLKAGAEVNMPEGGGNTPLFWAAWGGQLEIVELLLARGADPEKKCSDCDSPIQIAEKRGNTGVAAMLRQHQGPAR
jgi:ankyrin repeat protein